MMSLIPAYVDPTAGGMLLQIILGGIAAIFLGIQIFWRRILSLFGIRRKPSATSQGDAAESKPDPDGAGNATAPVKDQT